VAHWRALFVLFHLVAVTLMALPAPEGAMDRANWADPTVQAEIAVWARRLSVPPADLEEALWRFATRYTAARDRVLAPFGPYYEWCGTEQSWRMFVAPHRHPTRLHVDVREGGEWRAVFVERDREHAWLARQLCSYRFRSLTFRFGWPSYAGEYRSFADWLAHQAARDFPDADRVRVRMFRFRTPSPAEVRAGRPVEGRFESAVELPLEGRR
jgi:hypothetical protein